jgi:hypothetical protein
MSYQKCPVCNGVGQVSGGYFDRAGDCDTWVSGNSTEKCKVCQGRGIIAEPVQSPPYTINNQTGELEEK